jgi:hypothetical protein
LIFEWTLKYPETLKGNNFKIPRPNFFKFGTVLYNGWKDYCTNFKQISPFFNVTPVHPVHAQIVIVYFIPKRKVFYSCRENKNSLLRGLPRGELVLDTQEWYFCRGLYTILFTINYLIKQATL